MLLRNERVGERAALPFGPEVRRLAVLGRNVDVENLGDRGSSNVVAGEVTTALEGLRARSGVTVTHVTALDAAGETALREADAVVVVTGLQADDEGEGEIGAGDRASIALRESEIALIQRAAALNPRVVVVVEAGAAVTVDPWNDEVEAVLFTGYPGEEGGHALAEVLFGDVSPSGRLPFVIPAREGDLGDFDNTSATVTYGYLHGYRLLASRGVAARYDFGHGLSYTRFSRREPRLSAGEVALGGVVELSVEVRNEGAVRGVDVVQVYASVEGSPRAARPAGPARLHRAWSSPRRVAAGLGEGARWTTSRAWDEAGARWVLDLGATRHQVLDRARAQGTWRTWRRAGPRPRRPHRGGRGMAGARAPVGVAATRQVRPTVVSRRTRFRASPDGLRIASALPGVTGGDAATSGSRGGPRCVWGCSRAAG